MNAIKNPADKQETSNQWGVMYEAYRECPGSGWFVLYKCCFCGCEYTEKPTYFF